MTGAREEASGGTKQALSVWYITMQFPSPSETFASHDVKQLSKQGVDVSVHSLLPRHSTSDALETERNLEGIDTTHGGFQSIVQDLGTVAARPLRALALGARIVRWCWTRPSHLIKSLVLVPRALGIYGQIRRHKPDVVHLFWGHYPSMVGFLAQQDAAPPVVSMFLGAYDLEMDYGGSAPVARAADVVWTHAQTNVAPLLRRGIPPDKIRVVYRGTDLTMYERCSKKTPGRIVTIGRLVPEKGMDDVLRAFVGVQCNEPDATLVVLGDGPDRTRLEDLAGKLGIRGSVEFKGHVSHDQVVLELCEAQVFIMMSRKSSERLPNAVKEAMGCRSLCVVTKTPGIDELIEDGRSGYIIEQRDIEGATQRVLDGFKDADTRARMTEMAYRHLEASFGLVESMTEYLHEWLALARQNTRSEGRDETSTGQY